MVRPTMLLASCSARSSLYEYRYSTGSNLNTYSALIQNFYSQETAPHQAIHLQLNTGTEEGQQTGVKAYIRFVVAPSLVRDIADFIFSSPVGVTPKPENAVFVPIPCELQFKETERSGRKLYGPLSYIDH